MKQTTFFLLILSCAACDQGIAPPPAYYPNLLSQANADSIGIEFTDYDKVRITHQFESPLKSREFQRIGIGILDSTGYREVLSSSSQYDPAYDIFSLAFDFLLSLDSTKITTPIILRFYRRDSGFIDVDTTIQQYKYPYPNAEIFLTSSIMVWPIDSRDHFQDIDRIGNKFYFHPTGPQGLFEYDLNSEITRYLFPYGTGDHIAADSIFVFCDIGLKIVRYNILADSVDLTVATFPTLIRGLETYQGSLYAITYSSAYAVRKYTYDGALIDSSTISGSVFHLTISNGILYTTDFYATIRRFELSTMNVLSSVSGPARNLEGIRIYDDHLYFCDFYKRMVGSVPLQDLR